MAAGGMMRHRFWFDNDEVVNFACKHRGGDVPISAVPNQPCIKLAVGFFSESEVFGFFAFPVVGRTLGHA